MENKFKEKYIRIAKDHFNETFLPKLKEVLGEAHNDVVVFISGSVSHGYCDKLSDIDIGVLFLEQLDSAKETEVKSLLGEYFVGNVRLTYWNEERNKSRFKKILQGQIDEVWDNPAVYFFFDTVNYIPIFDKKNILKSIQIKISFYPKEFFKSLVRGFWITTNDSGIYLVEQCITRKKNVEGYIAFYKAVEASLRLTFLLNGKYFPPTKWITTGIKYLDNDFGAKSFLRTISGNNLEKDLENYKKFVAKIKNFMTENKVIEETSIENCWTIFKNDLPWHVYSNF